MSILNIRNLPDKIHSRLRLRAARNGRSMEAEAREILTRTCLEESVDSSVEDLQGWVESLYNGNKPDGVVDDLIRDRRLEAEEE